MKFPLFHYKEPILSQGRLLEIESKTIFLYFFLNLSHYHLLFFNLLGPWNFLHHYHYHIKIQCQSEILYAEQQVKKSFADKDCTGGIWIGINKNRQESRQKVLVNEIATVFFIEKLIFLLNQLQVKVFYLRQVFFRFGPETCFQ